METEKMKNKTEIEEIKSDFTCPECNIALKFESRIYSKKQIEEQEKYYRKMKKMKIFRYFHIGVVFHQSKEVMEMRCPKCQKLYYVEKQSQRQNE